MTKAQAKKFKTIEGVEYKKCPECPKRERSEWNSVTEYGVRKNSSTGYAARCKTCVNEDVTRVRKAAPKYIERKAVLSKVEEANKTHKHCASCKNKGREPWVLRADFYPNRSKTDGLSSYCTQCDLEDKGVATAQRRASRPPSVVKTTRFCADCNEERPFTEFGRRSDRQGGFKPYCKKHTNERQKKYYGDNPEFAEGNRAASRKWAQDNPQQHSDRTNAYQKKRSAVDLDYKLRGVLRTRIAHAVARYKKGQKAGSAVKDLGCSIEHIISYLESKFTKGMSWDNHGTHWEIDHIQPLVDFNLTDRKQFLVACSYKNLQPLTIKEHQEKTAQEASTRCITSIGQ